MTRGVLTVLTQDPRFGGGVVGQLRPFVTSARALGRKVELIYLEHPSLSQRPLVAELTGEGFRSRYGRMDALNQVVGGSELVERLRAAESIWLVATTASYGAAALRAGRPFGAWIGSGFRAETEARLPFLPASRRVALRVNRPALERVERSVVRSAEPLRAVSRATARDLGASSGRSAIQVLPIPVDTTLFTPSGDEEWLGRLRSPHLLFVGRARDPRKNLAMLLEAFSRVRKTIPSARLVLAGEPPAFAPPPGVDVLGAVDDLPAVLRRSSLLALPSLQEGFGIVVAEALAAGVPVVSTPSGGPEGILSESGGGIVTRTFAPGEFALTAIRLLRNERLAVELRRRARAYAEAELSLSVFRGRLAAVLEEVGVAS